MSIDNNAPSQLLKSTKQVESENRRNRAIAEEQAQLKQTKKETSEGFLSNLRNKVFSLESLIKFGCYRFHFSQDLNEHGNTIGCLGRMFAEHEVSLYDFDCHVQSMYKFSKLNGQRLAIIEGVPFFMSRLEPEITRNGSLIVYTPIWMRDKAKKVLMRELKKHRTSKRLGHASQMSRAKAYSNTLAKTEQFIRPEDYKYIDRIFDRLVNDKKWYEESGRDYKETFLLYGAPGTAKTTAYMHFGAKYELNIFQATPESFVRYFESITTRALNDDRKPLMVLIEDIDACYELLTPEYKAIMRSNAGGYLETEEGFTYSRFINALNGAEKLHNMIVCMSTNFKERLIPSIYRSGRVDHQLDMKPLTSVEIAARVNTELSEYIASHPDYTFSVANIIELRFARTKEDIDEMVKWLHNEAEFKKTQEKNHE